MESYFHLLPRDICNIVKEYKESRVMFIKGQPATLILSTSEFEVSLYFELNETVNESIRCFIAKLNEKRGIYDLSLSLQHRYVGTLRTNNGIVNIVIQGDQYLKLGPKLQAKLVVALQELIGIETKPNRIEEFDYIETVVETKNYLTLLDEINTKSEELEYRAVFSELDYDNMNLTFKDHQDRIIQEYNQYRIHTRYVLGCNSRELKLMTPYNTIVFRHTLRTKLIQILMDILKFRSRFLEK